MSLCPAGRWDLGPRSGHSSGWEQDPTGQAQTAARAGGVGAGAGAQRLISEDPCPAHGGITPPSPQREPCPEAPVTLPSPPWAETALTTPPCADLLLEEESCADAQDGELDGLWTTISIFITLFLLSVCYSATVTLFKVGGHPAGPSGPLSVPRVPSASLPVL